MSDVELSISIPADNDGYFLLKCEHCGEYFKLTGQDVNNDDIFEISCPACGLSSESFITEDVLNLAIAMTKNYAIDMLYDAVKDWERKMSNGFIQVKAGHRPDPEPENPIKTGIDALEVAEFNCCGRSAKIKPLLKFTGCYCPCCGVKNYEVK